MKATIRWVDDAMFVGEAGSGHAVVIDGPPEAGGRNAGLRPMELVLTGVGACSAFDVVAILKKSRQAVTDCRVEVSGERAETIPQVFTRIHLHFVVAGEDLKPSAVERAVSLSAQKYCSATQMLRASVDISHDFEILDGPLGEPDTAAG